MLAVEPSIIKARELDHLSYDFLTRIHMIHGQYLSLRQNDEYSKTLFVYRQHISILIGLSRFKFNSFATESKAICLDIGANIGYISVYLALRDDVDRIYSFEPNHETFKILELNVSYYKKIVPNQMIVSQSSGMGFHLPNPTNSAHSRTGTGQENSNLNVNSVCMISVDDFVEKHGLDIHFIKIDVEGHEIEVLEGARKTISSQAPLVLLELYGIREYRYGIVNQLKSVFFSEITSIYQILVADHDGFLSEIDIDKLLSLEVNDIFLVPNTCNYRH